MNQKGMFGWLYSQMGKKKSSFFLSVVFAILEVVCGFIPFIIVADVVNKLIDGVKDIKVYTILVSLMLLFFILKVVFHAISTTTSHTATFNILSNIRKNCTEKLSRMQLGDVLARNTGSLKSIIYERVDALETTLAHMVPDVSANCIVPIGMFIIMMLIDWRMGLVSLLTLPVGMVCFALMMNVSNKGGYFEKAINATKNLNDTTIEYINGMEVIKVFGKTKSSYEKFQNACNDGANSYINWMKKSNIFMTFAMSITPATMLSVLPIGGIFLLNHSITLASLISIIICSVALIAPIITVMSYEDDFAQVGQTIVEIRSILDAKELDRPLTLAKENTPIDNSISLKDVHFAYQDKEVLHGINIDIDSGQYVALVGPSGSGKSTIAKLIASMWDINSGEILVGKKNIKNIPINDYQDMVAYVCQDNYLFNESIMDNIRMGKTDGIATDEEVISVAKKSGCHEFIMSLENGYDTIVGSAGGHLSGGERQRVSIARAMLKNAPIVILDEATAYTDPENEAVIQESVAKLVKDKTLIVIAHRLSTIMNADKIICINDGNVEEMGTHEQLLNNNGLYKKMWDAHISAKDSKEGI